MCPTPPDIRRNDRRPGRADAPADGRVSPTPSGVRSERIANQRTRDPPVRHIRSPPRRVHAARSRFDGPDGVSARRGCAGLDRPGARGGARRPTAGTAGRDDRLGGHRVARRTCALVRGLDRLVAVSGALVGVRQPVDRLPALPARRALRRSDDTPRADVRRRRDDDPRRCDRRLGPCFEDRSRARRRRQPRRAPPSAGGVLERLGVRASGRRPVGSLGRVESILAPAAPRSRRGARRLAPDRAVSDVLA